jgi:hypothetical protein
MIIVRLLFSEPVGWLRHHQLYLDLGADIVMESISPMSTGDFTNEYRRFHKLSGWVVLQPLKIPSARRLALPQRGLWLGHRGTYHPKVQNIQQRDSNEFQLFRAALISRMILLKVPERQKKPKGPERKQRSGDFYWAGILRGSLYRSSVSSSWSQFLREIQNSQLRLPPQSNSAIPKLVTGEKLKFVSNFRFKACF